MVKDRRQSYVLEAVMGILTSIVGHFIYDKARALNWNRIKPLLVRVAIEAVVAIAAGATVLLVILYLPLAP